MMKHQENVLNHGNDVMYCFHFRRDGENVDAGTETNVNLNQEVYYHFLGTNQSEDILCWRDPDNPKYSHGASVTDDGKVTSFVSVLCCSLCIYVGSTSDLLECLNYF